MKSVLKKYFQALYQSFGHLKLYHDVIHNWTGGGLTYLLVPAFLTALLLASQFSFIVYKFAQNELPILAPQVPDITLNKGVVEMTAPQPYFIKDRDQNIVITIDTTKNQTELAREKGNLLIGKDFVLSRKPDGAINTIDLNKFKDQVVVITSNTIHNLFKQFSYITILFIPILMLGQWLMLIMMTLGAACLSYIVTAYMREEYDLETRMRIGVIAITPAFIINKFLQSVSTYHLGLWITLAMWIMFMYVIILGNRYYTKNLPSSV